MVCFPFLDSIIALFPGKSRTFFQFSKLFFWGFLQPQFVTNYHANHAANQQDNGADEAEAQNKGIEDDRGDQGGQAGDDRDHGKDEEEFHFFVLRFLFCFPLSDTNYSRKNANFKMECCTNYHCPDT